MKDLLINASILSEKKTGLGVYTYQMLKYVCPLLDQDGITYDVMCSSKEYVPDAVRDKVRAVSFDGFLSRNINTSKVYKDHYKVVWSTTQHGAPFFKGRQIITIHDVTPLLYPNGRKHQTYYYKWVIPQVLRNHAGVITVSENTKKDIEHYYKKWIKDDEQVKVIYESINTDIAKPEEAASKRTLDKYNLFNHGYICVTGIHYEYKNIETVITAFAANADLQAKLKIVIIGNDKNEYGNRLHQLVNQNKLQNRVVFTGFISDEQKNILLSSSFACVIPSKYEGFGLPVLEGMKANTLVISSDRSSLREVGGEAAVYFDPDDYQQLADILRQFLEDEGRRSGYILSGQKNLDRFQWNQIAQEMHDYLVGWLS